MANFKVVEQGFGSNKGYLVTDGKSNQGLYDTKAQAQAKCDKLNNATPFTNGRNKALAEIGARYPEKK